MPRYQMALDVALSPHPTLPDEPAASVGWLRTLTVDLSPTGLCCYTDLSFPVGAALFVHLTVPGTVQAVEAASRLVWCRKLNGLLSGYRIGVEFTAMLDEHRRILAAFLERPPAPQQAPTKRVLLAHDDEEFRKALQLRLESCGFEVLTAADGLDALRKGRTRHPHLILMDVALPNLTGLDVCRLLHAEAAASPLPIILFSTRNRREDAERSRRAGADAFLPIPFSGQALMAKVDELLLRQAA